MDGSSIAYAMHENSVIRIVGYVTDYFADGAEPIEPWSLCLNFNHKHKIINLRPEHFASDGENVTPILMREIEEIDPGWKVKGGIPIFEEAATKKRLKIDSDWRELLDNPDNEQITFYSVMDEVFGKSQQI
jgi:hypothetical protein